MPIHSRMSPNAACPNAGKGASAGKSMGAGKGLGMKAMGTKGGAGACGIAGKGAVATTAAWGGGGACVLGGKGATTVAFTVAAAPLAGTTAAGHGISLGLGLGLGAWGPLLLGAGVVALGGYLYKKGKAQPAKRKKPDELAAALAGRDA